MRQVSNLGSPAPVNLRCLSQAGQPHPCASLATPCPASSKPASNGTKRRCCESYHKRNGGKHDVCSEFRVAHMSTIQRLPPGTKYHVVIGWHPLWRNYTLRMLSPSSSEPPLSFRSCVSPGMWRKFVLERVMDGCCRSSSGLCMAGAFARNRGRSLEPSPKGCGGLGSVA